MSDRIQAVLLFAVCCLVLLIALKLGVIGGGGAGADRKKNAFNFWLGVGTTGLIAMVALAIFISTFFR